MWRVDSRGIQCRNGHTADGYGVVAAFMLTIHMRRGQNVHKAVYALQLRMASIASLLRVTYWSMIHCTRLQPTYTRK